MLFNGQESHGQISIASFIASSRIHHKYSSHYTLVGTLLTFQNKSLHSPYMVSLRSIRNDHTNHFILPGNTSDLFNFANTYMVGGSSAGPRKFCSGLHPSLLHLNIPRRRRDSTPSQFLICRLGLGLDIHLLSTICEN